jgi:hypothetical protein
MPASIEADLARLEQLVARASESDPQQDGHYAPA